MNQRNNLFTSLWYSDKTVITLLAALCSAVSAFTAFRMLFIQGKTFAAFAACLAVIAAIGMLFYCIIKKYGSAAFAAKIRRGKMVYFSIILATVLSFFAFAVYGLTPFGDYTVLRMDLYHQYGPLFAELYDKIAGGKSLLYSWNSAGGSGFLGNYFNYLSSPFTLLIFWFSKEKVITFSISLIIFAKCIGASGTMAYYLKKRFESESWSICAFSLLYAFSAYFIAYFWNVMWLDAMFIFPLVMLGIERIIDRSEGKLYFGGLAYSFLTNYYMAYMICIFSVLYFITYYLSRYSLSALYVPKTRDMPRISKIRQSRFLCAGLRFAFTSVFAVICCAAVLLPIYKVLSSSSATGNDFPSESKFYFDIYDFLAAHLAALEPTVRSSGGDVTPNIYCGIITVLLFPLFLMNKHISWKEKTANSLLLILLFVCCNVNTTNFIWHGFHFPNDLPYRFSFMYSFVLLTCAFSAFRYIRDYNYKTLVTVSGVFILVCVLAQKFDLRYVDDMTIYASIAFAIVYTFVLCATVSKKMSNIMASVVLCCVVICEVLVCDVPKFEFGVKETDYVADYANYRKALEFIKENDDGFYRVELNDIPNGLRMSPCWYNYEGINCFSSMANESVANMQFKLGNFSNKINSFMYHNQTPIYNLMFNIGYVIDNNNPLKLNETYFTYLRGSREKQTVYRSAYPSSIAFCVDRAAVKHWTSEKSSGNPFEIQNKFMQLATDTEDEFFEKVKIFTNGAQNCSLTSFENDGNGSLSFSVFNEGQSASFDTNFTADKAGNYYLYVFSSNSFEKADIETGHYSKIQEIENEPYLMDLGTLEKGEEVNITTHIDSESSGGSGYIWAYRFNDKAFKKAYQKLADGGMLQITERTDTHIKGTVTAGENEVLYTSIPYESGWQCYVDGIRVKPYQTNECLIALETGTGTHTVEFRYFPAGLETGLLISGCSIGIIAVYFILKKALIFFIKKATDEMLTH